VAARTWTRRRRECRGRQGDRLVLYESSGGLRCGAAESRLRSAHRLSVLGHRPRGADPAQSLVLTRERTEPCLVAEISVSSQVKGQKGKAKSVKWRVRSWTSCAVTSRSLKSMRS